MFQGLVVPVLRNVEQLNYAGIEQGLSDLGEKARTGALAIEDMDGGTFTISNGGVFGSLMGTPIINPPQSAILGMHGVFDRPVAIKGQVYNLFSLLLSIPTVYFAIYSYHALENVLKRNKSNQALTALLNWYFMNWTTDEQIFYQ